MGLVPHLRAPQHRADARQKLARTERLGEIVVGAKFQAHDAIGFLGATGEDDDGDLRFGTQLPQQRHAVLTAQPQIKQHQIYHADPQRLHEVSATGSAGHTEIVVAEVFRDQLPHRTVVIDHEDVRHRHATHGARP